MPRMKLHELIASQTNIQRDDGLSLNPLAVAGIQKIDSLPRETNRWGEKRLFGWRLTWTLEKKLWEHPLKRPVVLTGGSGTGKTCAAISVGGANDRLCVYLQAKSDDEVNIKEEQVKRIQDQGEELDLLDKREIREKVCVEYLTRMVKETVQKDIERSRTKLGPRTDAIKLTVVLDDAYKTPALVQGLLNRWNDQAERQLNKVFQEEWWGEVEEPRLLVCGAINSDMIISGRIPAFFLLSTTKFMGDDSKHLGEDMVRKASGTGFEDLEELEKMYGPMVKALSQNPRALRLVLQEVTKAGGKNEITPKHLVRKVCRELGRLNGLENLVEKDSDKKLLLDYATAILLGQKEWKYCHHLPRDSERDFDLDEEMWRASLEPWAQKVLMDDLKGVQKMLVRDGRLVEDMMVVENSINYYDCTLMSGSERGHRFRMAPWTVVMIMTNFGQDLEPALYDAEGFEKVSAVMFKLGVRLAMRRGLTVGDLVRDVLGLEWRKKGGELSSTNDNDPFLKWKLVKGEVEIWKLQEAFELMEVDKEGKQGICGMKKGRRLMQEDVDKMSIECKWMVPKRLVVLKKTSEPNKTAVSVSIGLNKKGAAHGDVLMSLLVEDADGKESTQMTWIIQTQHDAKGSHVSSLDWNEKWFQCNKIPQASVLGETRWVMWGRHEVWPEKERDEEKREEGWVGCAERMVGLRLYLKAWNEWNEWNKRTCPEMYEESVEVKIEGSRPCVMEGGERKRRRDDGAEEDKDE